MMANCLVRSPSFFSFVLLSAALVSYEVSMVATAQSAPPAQARVGVILDLTTPVGRRRRTGIQMAVEGYYAAHLSSAMRVALHFRDSTGDPLRAASAAVDLIKNAQAQAIIGPPTSAEAEFVARIGDHAHVPVISYSATSPALTAVQTPFFVRTAANDSFQTAPVAAVLGAFRWRAAVVVYEDTPYGTGILPALSDALQGVGAKIMDRTAVPSDADDARLDAVLYHFMAMPTRVFVVHMLYPLAARLFRRAKKAGMMSQEYVWVATDGVGSFMDRLSPEDVDAMQGVVSLQPYVQLTDAAKNFSARLMARSRRENPADGGVGDSTLMRLWSYDTAWAIAAAVETARVPSPAFQTPGGTTALTDLDRLGVSATGTSLLKAVLATTFEGIAGKFKLVDGQLQLPAYEVVNIIGRGARTVSFWTPEFGITQDLNPNSAKALRQILWPGEPRSAPKGWTVSPNGRVQAVLEKITGYCIDVFDEVMKNLPYPVSYRYVPQNVSLDSYDKLVDLVHDQKFDLVVGDVTVTASRMAEVDFTMPFTESGWSMVVAAQEDTGSNMWIFVRPLSTGLWLASLGFLCFTGFVVWVIEHRINPEFRGTPCQQFGLIFYFAFSTLTFSHREKLQSNLSRFIVIMWVFVVLILTSSYTASLTSMLTVQKLLPTVTDVRELQRNGHYIGYQEGSFIESSLQKMGFDQSRMRKYNSLGERRGRRGVRRDPIPYLKLFLSEYCKDYMMVGPIYKTVGPSTRLSEYCKDTYDVFPKDSPMTGDVSRGILTLAEREKMSKIEKAWFGEPDACLQQSSAEVAPSSGLRFMSFGGIFLLTGLASGLTLLVYLATFAIRERSGLRAAEATAGSGSGSHYDTRDLRSPTFRTRHDEFAMNSACDCANRTPTWNDESVRNGGASPFSVRVDSEMNAASSLENTPASEAGNSLEQGVEGATTSVEMATSTGEPQLHR
ncbi:hypothetical protein VPH35_031379 [Triticum aestivum]